MNEDLRRERISSIVDVEVCGMSKTVCRMQHCTHHEISAWLQLAVRVRVDLEFATRDTMLLISCPCISPKGKLFVFSGRRRLREECITYTSSVRYRLQSAC